MRFKYLFFLALAFACFFKTKAEEAKTAEIIFPEGMGHSVGINGLSDNGRWVVSGSTIYDISGSTITKRTLSSNGRSGSARDISEDGKVAVGSFSGGPGVWKEDQGWLSLPTPAGKRGGQAIKVTPDGRYAVGTVGNDGCMWDLSDLSIIELPERPLEDRRGWDDPDPNNFENYYENVSPDGRYVQGILSWSYVGDQTAYVYDRQTDETHYIGFKKNGGKFTPDDPAIHYTECNGMSADGHYLTGCAYILHGPEYLTAYRYDVWNDTFEYFDATGQSDAWGFGVSNDGLVFLRRPAQNPYNDGYVCYNGFYYAFADIMTLGYGINLMKYGIENTGTPVLCSADGRTLVFYSYEIGYYIMRFPEPLQDVCDRLDLLQTWNCSPRSGSVMSKLSNITFEFPYPIEASALNFTKVELLDEDGNVLANPVAANGVSASGNTLRIVFRSRLLDEGKTYTIKIGEGVCNVEGLPNNINKEIRIHYVGRKAGPVEPIRIFPENMSTIGSINMQTDPILVTFDADLTLNTSITEPILMYIDDNPVPVANLYAGLYRENVLAIYPLYEQPLYKESIYTVKVPAGIVGDISGEGASEAFEISYYGNFVPQLGDEKYIFKHDCDNFDNLLFYEGDYGSPTSEYYGMGFTTETTPWWVVRDNVDSTDMALASHSSYSDGRQADDWFTTRQLYIPDETVYLAFDGQSYRRNKTDVLKIYAFVNDGIINSLTSNIINQIVEEGDLIFDEALDPGATEGGLDGEWTHYVIPLDKYAGKNIYICFVNRNQNQSLVIVDNIEVARVVNSFVSLSTPTNVVGLEEVEIKGYLVVENELADYHTANLMLKDSEGKLISSIKAEGLSLKRGESFNFEFPEKLPLLLGEENHFSIEFSLDDEEDTYSGLVRSLTFEPTKRVVLEEFTGRDCQFCPQGLAMIDRLSNMFPNNFIPVGLYCYMGTDPKGFGMMDYLDYLGMTAAPSGRINRRPTSMSLYSSSALGRYVYSASELPEGESADLWYDDVVAELAEPAYIEVKVATNDKNSSTLSYTAQFQSAVNLKDQNLRVFGVLLENGLEDYQVNGVYFIEDELLGEWGAGKAFGSEIVSTTFDHAARATWGRGYTGTANLLPYDLTANKIYEVPMDINVPGTVEKVENCEFVVMLIDGNSGRIINAATSSDLSGVETIQGTEDSDVEIRIEGKQVTVIATGQTTARVYAPSGMLISQETAEGIYQLYAAQYNGLAIIEVTSAKGTVTKKVMFK